MSTVTCAKYKFIIAPVVWYGKTVSSVSTNKSATRERPCVSAFVTMGREIDLDFKSGFSLSIFLP